MEAVLGAVLAAARACSRLTFVAVALLFLAAAAAPVAAQQPGSVNPNADAVKEQQLLQQLNRIQGLGSIPDTKSYVIEQPIGRVWQTFHEVWLRWIGGIAMLGMLAVLIVFYLWRGTVRVKSGLNNGVYARDTSNTDDRFVDYFGGSDTIVTSSGSMDSGMFETNLHDERFLPFEGAGAVSSWSLSLPAQLRPFDYTTISDVILHIHYTARDAGDALAAPATKELVAMLDTVGQSGQALMFCLRFDFPSQWYAFVTGTANFTLDLTKDLLPYMVQSANRITIDALTLYAAIAGKIVSVTPTVDLGALASGLSATAGTAILSLPSDATVMTRDPNQQVFLVMQYHFGA